LTTRDDEFEFDFFDEPDEETVTQRRRAVRAEPRPKRGPRRPRGPAGPPAGLTPILRLVGLIAAAIVVVVLLVFWIQGCQSGAKARSYRHYMEDATAIAKTSTQTGATLNSVLVTPGIKEPALVTKIDGLAQQGQQTVQRAESLNPPGHLREANGHLIEALQFRVSGLRGLSDAFRSTAKLKASDSDRAGTVLAKQAERLLASDIVWDDLFLAPSQQILQQEGVHGVAVPESHVVGSVDVASAATFANIFKQIKGASTGGSAGGLHGTGIESVTALPQNLVLSRDTSTPNKVVANTSLAFEVAVKDTGDNLEGKIPVTLTIVKQGAPITQTKTIEVINPGETVKLVFRNIDATGILGAPVTLKVDVTPVKNEAKRDNNSYEYPVIFSLTP
jgi:hypothetical protein